MIRFSPLSLTLLALISSILYELLSSSIINPSKAKQVSSQLRAFLYEGFLADKECNHFISLVGFVVFLIWAKSELKRSAVANNESGKSELSEVQTSSRMFIAKGKVHVFQRKASCAAFLANYDTNSAAKITFQNMQYDLPRLSIGDSVFCLFSCQAFYDKRLTQEVIRDTLGENADLEHLNFDWIGTPSFHGDGRCTGERWSKSVCGCIVSPDLSVLNLVIVKKRESKLPGLTDTDKPRLRGPNRASKICKLFNISREDNVQKYVNTYRWMFTDKAGRF
ncbi:hypothetical protein RHSIM_Rhsim03G0071800 [Rhododendron simsii]|uniref:Beta-galactosidase beta-sandwich domain-containing protein n=1 Tax=Rhododendron simsii TaxID=118357 RepID=A0A834HD88_RHOSS|nr:hypothetical protein RHSIM_Rhsim03G0071800 [Rhododendron simsii]